MPTNPENPGGSGPLEDASEERRRAPRHPVLLRVATLSPEGGESTENVSSTGLFVRTERQLALGEAVRLQLSFPGLLEPFEVEGTVRWIRAEGRDQPSGAGVRLSAEGRRRMEALLDLLRRKPLQGAAFRILLVEDNEHVASLYRFALRRIEGVALEIDHVRDGHAALRAIARARPDLVLADLVMPVLDGVEMLRRLRAAPETRSLPVVVISAADRALRVAAEEAGADAVLRKPVRSGDVVATVRALLAARSGTAAG